MAGLNLGHVTAYGYAKSKGYTGTEAEFAQTMLELSDAIGAAQEAAESAEGFADSAEGFADDASASATEASNSATTVINKIDQAETIMARATSIGNKRYVQDYLYSGSTTVESVTFNPTGYVYSITDIFSIYVGGEKLNAGTNIYSIQSSGNSAVITYNPVLTVQTNEAIEVIADTEVPITTDVTLSLNGAAADAKATGDAIGDLRDDLTHVSGSATTKVEITNWKRNIYVDTGSPNIGDTIDITNFSTGETVKHVIVDCEEGDTFLLSLTGASGARAWAFLTSNNVLISRADANVTLSDFRITAPQNASKIIIQCVFTDDPARPWDDGKAYKDIPIDLIFTPEYSGDSLYFDSDGKLDNINIGVKCSKPLYNDHYGFAYNDPVTTPVINGSYPTMNGFESSSNWWRSDYIEINPQYGFYYRLSRSASQPYSVDNVFYDENKTPIKEFYLFGFNHQSHGYEGYEKYTAIPANAKYMIVSNARVGRISINNYSGMSDVPGMVYNPHIQDGYFYYPYETIIGEYPTPTGIKNDDPNWKRSEYIPINPEKGFYYKSVRSEVAYDTNGDNAFYDKDKNYISMFTLYNNENDYVLCSDIPDNAAYMIISTHKNYYIDVLNYGLTDDFNGSESANDPIIANNIAVLDEIKDAKFIKTGKTTVPFCLLQFGDVHGHTAELQNVVKMANYLGSELDDIIYCGDMMQRSYADSIDFWNSVEGAENILVSIGNHDVCTLPNDEQYGNNVTMQNAYDKYMAPYIQNWDVTYTQGRTYYYKDYSAKKIRLICVDYLLTGTNKTDQLTWFTECLSGAKTLGYTVIVFNHMPVQEGVYIDCGFTMKDNPWESEFHRGFLEDLQQAIQTFKNNGGKFACFLVGHAHGDMIRYHQDYPDQLCVVVTCAMTSSYYSDQRRVSGTKSADAFNIVVVNTEMETITLIRVGANTDMYLRPRNVLTISYNNKAILSDY